MAKIAILLADGFEDSELTGPKQRLEAAGHDCVIIGSEADKTLSGKRGKTQIQTSAGPGELSKTDFAALLIPGGYSPDKLRLDQQLVDAVRAFHATGKPIAAICHGPQLLIEADIVRGCRVTSWPSIRTDLENAGAQWLDAAVVEDGPFITSRKPNDIAPFSEALLNRLKQIKP